MECGVVRQCASRDADGGMQVSVSVVGFDAFEPLLEKMAEFDPCGNQETSVPQLLARFYVCVTVPLAGQEVPHISCAPSKVILRTIPPVHPYVCEAVADKSVRTEGGAFEPQLTVRVWRSALHPAHSHLVRNLTKI